MGNYIGLKNFLGGLVSLAGGDPTMPNVAGTPTTNPMATVRETDDGFGLFTRNGHLVQTYSRARDARRGATRRGWSIA